MDSLHNVGDTDYYLTTINFRDEKAARTRMN
jgi:hypothetical protein